MATAPTVLPARFAPSVAACAPCFAVSAALAIGPWSAPEFEPWDRPLLRAPELLLARELALRPLGDEREPLRLAAVADELRLPPDRDDARLEGRLDVRLAAELPLRDRLDRELERLPACDLCLVGELFRVWAIWDVLLVSGA